MAASWVDVADRAGSLVPAELHDRTDYVLCKVSETVKRLADDALAELGLRGSHHAVLRLLGSSGAIPQQDLAGRLLVDPSTVVSLVDHLEAEGLVARNRSPRDRRVSLVGITDDGRELLRDADVRVADLQDRCFGALAEADRSRLHELLLTLAELPGPGGGPVPLTGEPAAARPPARRRRRDA